MVMNDMRFGSNNEDNILTAEGRYKVSMNDSHVAFLTMLTTRNI